MFRSSIIFRSIPFLRNRVQSSIPSFISPARHLSLYSLSSSPNVQPSILNKIGMLRASGSPSSIIQKEYINPTIQNDPLAPLSDIEVEDNTMHMDSVLRKRRLKMKKHKLRKRRRAQRSLKKRLGKL
ncbi:uncharacterized protein AC631_00845 [Debaryomyces fabryi]|uniref:Small ribosomal subunit protein mS38 n=1 Tax=Debaryomyces fabryi TaxID=58627 RepID=A0A0V1Q4E1_9ASCO|nr:uncharacterized protein AC631_00845 [Debaryomyces fabryi]KSA03360.1 hypothetical protein AC631_00845 [Debaryomyces fabryi]CUM49925.1 unnamed protein product [Debaryomyces fabryi]